MVKGGDKWAKIHYCSDLLYRGLDWREAYYDLLQEEFNDYYLRVFDFDNADCIIFRVDIQFRPRRSGIMGVAPAEPVAEAPKDKEVK